jgi:hypothetical protein
MKKTVWTKVPFLFILGISVVLIAYTLIHKSSKNMLEIGGGLNVRHFGALGDGIADDTAAFIEAFKMASGGGCVIIPPGTYRVTAPIPVRSFTKVRGSGYQSRILSEAKTVFVLDVGNANYVERINLWGVNFSSTNKGTGIAYDSNKRRRYLANAVIDYCFFDRSLSEAIRVNLILSRISDCTFGYFGKGQMLYGIRSEGDHVQGSSNQNIISNNKFYSILNCAVYIGRGHNTSLLYNDFEECHGVPIMLNGASATYIHYNWFEKINSSSFVSCEEGEVGNVMVDIRYNQFYVTESQSAILAGPAMARGAYVNFTNNRVGGPSDVSVTLIGSVANAFVHQCDSNFILPAQRSIKIRQGD